MITKTIKIPTIGIGASKYCDGQILVIDDLIGLNPIKVRFVKKYSNVQKIIKIAVSKYSKEVKSRRRNYGLFGQALNTRMVSMLWM